jgi:hypothetical protein
MTETRARDLANVGKDATGLATDAELSSALGSKLDGALVLSEDFTSVSSLQVDNCFTSTYHSYKMMISITGATAGAGLRLLGRVSGTTQTASSYIRMYVGSNSTPAGPSLVYAISQNSLLLTILDNGDNFVESTVFNATGATTPYAVGQSVTGFGAAGNLLHAAGRFYAASDGFELSPASGTMTGKLRLYGLAD